MTPEESKPLSSGDEINYFVVSRELGALRPLGRSPPKDPEEPPVSEEELDFELFEPAPEAPLLSAPISEEPDFELFDAEEDEPEELADSTPSDFAVSESSRPVAFKLLAP